MSTVRAVMYFAPDPAAWCSWWAEHIGEGAEVHLEDRGFAWFELAGVEIGFHPADEERNPVGGSPVVYYNVEDLDDRREALLAMGCTHHRGPIAAEPGRRICQLIDPFGNTFGLDGP